MPCTATVQGFLPPLRGSDSMMTTLDINDEKITGRTVYEVLAETFRQMYVAPYEGATPVYKGIVERGEEPPQRSLSHFKMSEDDSLEYVDIPAGRVLCATIRDRHDFETILEIMGNRCEPEDIPVTQGATILDGVINRRKFERGLDYHDALIVLSVGPYSGTGADRMGVSDDEWIKTSDTIRRYHECTHFICRRLYPDQKDAIWDELVADATGLYAAYGSFDPEKEKVFLGIEGEKYVHGRLENYVEADLPEEKSDEAQRLVGRILPVLDEFAAIVSEADRKSVV